MSTKTNKGDIMHPTLCNYQNEIDYVNRLISIYSIIVFDEDNQLRKFERDVLNYYVRFGYSAETKKRISLELNKKPNTITQATFYLKEKGYLEDSKTNLSKKNLSKDLQNLKEAFLDGDKKILAIGFKRKG